MEQIRLPAVAGAFYPADSRDLTELINACLGTSPLGPRGIKKSPSATIAGMVPHAGYVYSGPCAAHFYSCLDRGVRRVIILGVNHRARGHHAALGPWTRWRTPLGEVAVDQEWSAQLAERVKFLGQDQLAHAEEHSIEVQLPFLERLLDDFTILPISLSYLPVDGCAALGAAIAELCRGETKGKPKAVILASSDLNHYLSPKETDQLDSIALERVLALDPEGLLSVVEDENISMCGVIPTAVMLFAAKALGVKRAALLKHCHSGDVAPMRKVVGYASVAFEL